MADPFRRLGIELRRIVTEGRAANLPRELILSRAATLLEEAGIDMALQQVLLGEALQQFDWLQERTLSISQQQDVVSILQTSGSGFAVIGGKVQEQILENVSRSIIDGAPVAEIEEMLTHRLGVARNYSRTIANTALQSFARSERWHKAIRSGVKKFRYVGPSPERRFCEQHHRNVYTADEVDHMRNDMGGSARLEGGGHNCRHGWLALLD